ncbi:hypothetical protein [uncultured Brevibacillus sp.]|uniref:hypothetical protein n=1 Tax=uncultured Brevibacillus sp. TaxID=169970 RepID=UPI002596FA50|nr:hypothetical protein [uncultured Brevibacillus sp.]
MFAEHTETLRLIATNLNRENGVSGRDREVLEAIHRTRSGAAATGAGTSTAGLPAQACLPAD